MITFAKEVIKGIKKINNTEMGVLPRTLLLCQYLLHKVKARHGRLLINIFKRGKKIIHSKGHGKYQIRIILHQSNNLCIEYGQRFSFSFEIIKRQLFEKMLDIIPFESTVFPKISLLFYSFMN